MISKKLSLKITDLEDFVEKEIWMPYLPMHPEFGNRDNDIHDYRKIAKKMSSQFDETIENLNKHKDWSDHVIDRIFAVGYWFPDYIQHPLVEKIKELTDKAENESNIHDAGTSAEQNLETIFKK